MFRTMLQFIFRDSFVYYTSYTCMILIKIYKLVDKMSLTALRLWTLHQLLRVHHLFVTGVNKECTFVGTRFYVIKKNVRYK
jgi:hypothetical protein